MHYVTLDCINEDHNHWNYPTTTKWSFHGEFHQICFPSTHPIAFWHRSDDINMMTRRIQMEDQFAADDRNL